MKKAFKLICILGICGFVASADIPLVFKLGAFVGVVVSFKGGEE